MSSVPLVVVNPSAGGGRTARSLPSMRPVIERALGEIELALTHGPGHAIEIAREAARAGRLLVVAMGGDGTLHEVANGVLEAGPEARTGVGFIGQGTGGDFRRSLGVEHRLDRYLAAIASGRERRVDVGKLTYVDAEGARRERFFINILSAGMGGLVDRYVADTSKAMGGKAAYFAASVRALASCKRGRLACTVTDVGGSKRREMTSYMIAICNGRFFGSGMHVAPMAEIDDGRFEVISLDAPTKLAFMLSAGKIYSGAHLRAPGVTHFGCEGIAIELADDATKGVFLLDVDGEPLGGLPIAVEIAPRALTMRA